MPTKREREYYRMGFRDGSMPRYPDDPDSPMGRMIMREDIARMQPVEYTGRGVTVQPSPLMRAIAKPKRKLSAWQRYIKNKRNHITYRDGKLNLKAMGVQYRKNKRR